MCYSIKSFLTTRASLAHQTMINFLISACAFVALAYSPLTLADQTTSIAKSNDEIQKYMAYEGNETLQGLVSAKYGISISGLLDLFSHEDDTDTDVSGPYYNSTPPEWQPKLLMHLVNEQIQKSNKSLKLIPERFVDNGKWYLEFSIKIESMTLDDVVWCRDVNDPPRMSFSRYRERGKRTDNFTFWALWPLYSNMNGTSIYCQAEFHRNGTRHDVFSETIPIVFQTVIEEVDNSKGPFVWPSAPVIMYDKPTLVELDCWARLRFNEAMTWYLKQGNNNEELESKKQNYEWGYVKLVFSNIFNSSDNGSVIVCEATPGPSRKDSLAPPQKITLVYNGPIDAKPQLEQTTELDNQEVEQTTEFDNQEVEQTTEFDNQEVEQTTEFDNQEVEQTTEFDNQEVEQTTEFDNQEVEQTTEFDNQEVEQTTEFDNQEVEQTTEFDNQEVEQTTEFDNQEVEQTTEFDNQEVEQTTEFDNQEVEQTTEFDNQEVEQTTEFATDECKNVVILGWWMLVLLALSAVVALATYIVHVAIKPDKKKPQNEDRNIPNA